MNLYGDQIPQPFCRSHGFRREYTIPAAALRKALVSVNHMWLVLLVVNSLDDPDVEADDGFRWTKSQFVFF